MGCHCDCDSFHCDCDSVTILTLATATNAQNSSKNAKGRVGSLPGKRNNVLGTLALELKFPKRRSVVQKKSNNVVQLVSCSEVFLDGILGAQVKPQEKKYFFLHVSDHPEAGNTLFVLIDKNLLSSVFTCCRPTQSHTQLQRLASESFQT